MTNDTTAPQQLLDATRALAVSGNACKVAGVHDRVYNTECVFTFHSPFTSDAGILVNLQTFIGTVQEMALKDDDQALFVRIVKKRVPKTKLRKEGEEDDDDEPKVPTKLGIGIEGGFASEQDKYETISAYSIVHLKKRAFGGDGGGEGSNSYNNIEVVCEIPYTNVTKDDIFPMCLTESVDSIINHASSTLQQDVAVWQMDQEDVPVSKYAADLPFVDNGVVISPFPENWKCQKSGVADGNVWLNLSDGYMGGGRQHWDGSGGSNGALDHYNETGKIYPLVVKLGTISNDIDAADCYSYAPDEDGPVKVPNLAELLAQRGIHVAHLQKTVKSTAELEVELNANYAFDAITESSSKLVPVAGPYLQGLQNLGNSCYMNSVVQVLFHMKEMAQRYGGSSPLEITQHLVFNTVSTTQAPDHVMVQTVKLAMALTTGAFARPDPTIDNDNDPKYRLAPRMFKHLIGKDHADFCTGQQQDAAQFLQYYLEKLDRAERGSGLVETPSSYFLAFATETRSVCTADQRVKYSGGPKDAAAMQTMWNIPIPMEMAKMVAKDAVAAATSADPPTTIKTDDGPDFKRHKSAEDQGDNGSEGTAATEATETLEEPVPHIDLMTCLDQWAAETVVEDIKWPHLGNATHMALCTTRLTNFPPYLLIQAQRYTMGLQWQPVKLQVEIEVPQNDNGSYVIDLKKYKSHSTGGPFPNELLVPKEDNAAAALVANAGPAIDEGALGQLMDMGFSMNACKRALNAVGGSNIEAAMSWVFEHNTDPDFNDPLPESEGGVNAGTSSSNVDEAVVQSLVDMLGCFTADQVRYALRETDNASDRAADWLFSHMNDLDFLMAASGSGGDGLGAASTTTTRTTSELKDSEDCSTYQLTGLISHIGKHTGSGHYVAHLLVNGKWIIFNDEKVAESTQPPVQHAYIYLFQRTDTMN